MSEAPHRRLFRRGVVCHRRVDLWFVEADAATIHIVDEWSRGEFLDSVARQELSVVSISFIQKQLHHHGQITGVCEESGMTRDTAHQSGSLIMHVALKQLHPEISVILRRSDLIYINVFQRLIIDMIKI